MLLGKRWMGKDGWKQEDQMGQAGTSPKGIWYREKRAKNVAVSASPTFWIQEDIMNGRLTIVQNFLTILSAD